MIFRGVGDQQYFGRHGVLQVVAPEPKSALQRINQLDQARWRMSAKEPLHYPFQRAEDQTLETPAANLNRLEFLFFSGERDVYPPLLLDKANAMKPRGEHRLESIGGG